MTIQTEKPTATTINFIQAVKGQAKPAAPIDIAVRTDTLCNLQLIAARLQRKLRWDPAKEAFVGDDMANRLRGRAIGLSCLPRLAGRLFRALAGCMAGMRTTGEPQASSREAWL